MTSFTSEIELSRVTLDTNILAYAEGLGATSSDELKVRRAREIMTLLGHGSDEGVIALQSLAELHRLLVRKAGLTLASAYEVIRTLAGAFETQPTDEATFAGALELASRHRLQIFDAIILSAAAQAGCEILHSEDMQHGFAWNGVRIVNPFLAKTTGA